MKRALLLALAFVVCGAAPAAAWDPVLLEDPAAQQSPDQSSLAVPGSDAAAAVDPAAPPASTEQAALVAPVVQPDNLYAVNQPWKSDQVTRSGNVTTYTSSADYGLTGTFARVADAVHTGQPSRYDGMAFNGRATRSDGQAVAGVYYENYEPVGDGFVLVNIVFFQDDSEMTVVPVADAGPGAPAPDAGVIPIVDDVRIPPLELVEVEPLIPELRERALVPENADVPTATADLRVGVDPTDGTRVLERLEVARGQRFALRVNAASGALAVAIDGWMLVSGTNDAANPAGWQPADAPLAGQWLRLAPPGTPWTLWLRVRGHLATGQSVDGDGRIEIWVRAPAIVQ